MKVMRKIIEIDYGVRIRLELLTNCNPERINY